MHIENSYNNNNYNIIKADNKKTKLLIDFRSFVFYKIQQND